MKKIYILIVSLVLMLTVIYYAWTNLFIFIGKEFNRAVYSVVLHNDTDMVVENITISYGRNSEDPASVFEVSQIVNLNPNEYRKVNISTTSPSEQAKAPYNVWAKLVHKESIEEISAGYFGIETGGLAVINVQMENQKLVLQRVFQHERAYKKIYRRNLKNQKELVW